MSETPRVAFVTGGASGIGRAVVSSLALGGLHVVLADIDETGGKEAAASTPNATFVPLDVTDRRSVETAAELSYREVGPVDVLVNCAGTDVVKPFLETDEELWTWLVQLNLIGVFRCVRAFLPSMVDRRHGRVINIASDAGRVGSAGEAVYSGCKGGVIAFTRTIAREVARYGVTANAVSPGPTETPALKRMIDAGGDRFVDALVRSIPVGRLGQPADVAAAVSFLASDEAAFVTGQTLSVSGGLSMC